MGKKRRRRRIDDILRWLDKAEVFLDRFWVEQLVRTPLFDEEVMSRRISQLAEAMDVWKREGD